MQPHPDQPPRSMPFSASANNVDDWSGVSNPVVRRRVQNRLNQRRYRLRRSRAVQKPAQGVNNTIAHPLPWYTNRVDLLAQIRLLRLTQYMKRSPGDDHLSCLVQFNVMQGFDHIMGILNFTPAQIMDDCSASPFVTDHPEVPVHLFPQRVGKDPTLGHLSPTLLQRTMDHHPWIDVIPFPEMRDNIIKALHVYSSQEAPIFDPDDLCYWMLSFGTSQPQRGLILWGDPCHVQSWEVSPDFLQRWGWLLWGCTELLRSTDTWRMRRGQEPLHITQGP